MMKHVDIYVTHTVKGLVADSAQYAYALMYKGQPRYGYDEVNKRITQNSIVLTAMKEAIARMNCACEITFHIDSQYIVNSFKNGNTDRWIKNGCRKANGSEIVDFTKWDELLKECQKHLVEVVYSEEHEMTGILKTGIRKGGVFEKETCR